MCCAALWHALLQTADKLTVEDVEVPADGDIGTAAVAAAVAPGGGRLQDDRLGLPAQRLIKTTSTNVDGQVGSLDIRPEC